MKNEELLLQAACFQWRDKLWLANHQVFAYRNQVFRIKNELDSFGHTQKTRMQQLAQNNATGITKGIWDELIMRVPTTWIEYKIPPNILSSHQKEFARRGAELGCHAFFIVTTLKEYQELIYELLRQDGFSI